MSTSSTTTNTFYILINVNEQGLVSLEVSLLGPEATVKLL